VFSGFNLDRGRQINGSGVVEPLGSESVRLGRNQIEAGLERNKVAAVFIASGSARRGTVSAGQGSLFIDDDPGIGDRETVHLRCNRAGNGTGLSETEIDTGFFFRRHDLQSIGRGSPGCFLIELGEITLMRGHDQIAAGRQAADTIMAINVGGGLCMWGLRKHFAGLADRNCGPCQRGDAIGKIHCSRDRCARGQLEPDPFEGVFASQIDRFSLQQRLTLVVVPGEIVCFFSFDEVMAGH